MGEAVSGREEGEGSFRYSTRVRLDMALDVAGRMRLAYCSWRIKGGMPFYLRISRSLSLSLSLSFCFLDASVIACDRGGKWRLIAKLLHAKMDFNARGVGIYHNSLCFNEKFAEARHYRMCKQ
jgi:hypothetical protein